MTIPGYKINVIHNQIRFGKNRTETIAVISEEIEQSDHLSLTFEKLKKSIKIAHVIKLFIINKTDKARS